MTYIILGAMKHGLSNKVFHSTPYRSSCIFDQIAVILKNSSFMTTNYTKIDPNPKWFPIIIVMHSFQNVLQSKNYHQQSFIKVCDHHTILNFPFEYFALYTFAYFGVQLSYKRGRLIFLVTFFSHNCVH